MDENNVAKDTFFYIDPQHPNRLITDMNDFDMIVINML